MVKIIITRTNLFIILVYHILLLIYLFYRGKNQLMRLVHLFCNLQKFSHNHRNISACSLFKPQQNLSIGIDLMHVDNHQKGRESILGLIDFHLPLD